MQMRFIYKNKNKIKDRPPQSLIAEKNLLTGLN